MTVICEMLGVPAEHREPFHDLGTTVLAGVFVTEQTFAEAADGLVALLRLLIELKRARPAEDLITALVAARDGSADGLHAGAGPAGTGSDGADRLSDDELTSMIWLLLVAGHETTVNLLSSGVLALLEHPEQLAALRADPTSIGPAVEELLRYCSPVQVTFPVISRADTELGGVPIATGDIVVPVVLAANRDPGRITDPDSLDLARAPNPHVAFGHGPHHCLGAPLARLEARIALTALLTRFPELELAVPAERVRYRPNFLFNGVEELPVFLGAPRS
jgi:cytochrome P450